MFAQFQCCVAEEREPGKWVVTAHGFGQKEAFYLRWGITVTFRTEMQKLMVSEIQRLFEHEKRLGRMGVGHPRRA